MLINNSCAFRRLWKFCSIFVCACKFVLLCCWGQSWNNPISFVTLCCITKMFSSFIWVSGKSLCAFCCLLCSSFQEETQHIWIFFHEREREEKTLMTDGKHHRLLQPWFLNTGWANELAVESCWDWIVHSSQQHGADRLFEQNQYDKIRKKINNFERLPINWPVDD